MHGLLVLALFMVAWPVAVEGALARTGYPEQRQPAPAS
jgi:hypothetical protein